MRVERTPDGAVRAQLTAAERMLLADLAGQLVEVLTSDADPAMERLLPNAYPDDPEAAAEFRRYTAGGLLERKAARARSLIAVVGDDDSHEAGYVLLDDGSAWAWMGVITDLRLTIAERLEIHDDDDRGRTDEAAQPLQQCYFWLGALQESLVGALGG